MYTVYILLSETDNTYYYGHTKDLVNRLKRHNQGLVRSTKSKRPWKIHYREEFSTKSEAYRRELFFKSVTGYIWLKENKFI